ncbi:MAG: cysteine hydrolase [Alphaproteobacteria bacterium]|nr:cysteine hydrolase [Alphaproteobacteria bacterium]
MSYVHRAASQKIQDIWGAVDSSSVAHVMVDVQRGFCDPAHAPQNASTDMDAVASRIANLQSAFHGAGTRSVIVYFDDLREGYDRAMGGPHKISSNQVDLIVAKRHQSAFEDTTLADELRARGVSHLLLSGFYADMCVT